MLAYINPDFPYEVVQKSNYRLVHRYDFFGWNVSHEIMNTTGLKVKKYPASEKAQGAGYFRFLVGLYLFGVYPFHHFS
jgi:hypothetical protein